MKKLIVATMMLCASTAQAADWSPVFKGWIGDCLFLNHPVAEAVFEVSSDYVPEYFTNDPHTVLSQEGQVGDYSAVPMPYRRDLLPATHLQVDYQETDNNDGFWYKRGVHIPLQNATFYNLPLYNIDFYDHMNAWFFELNFGKYSKTKESQLKKIITPLQKKPEYGSVILKRADGNLVLSCYEVTSG